MHPDDELQVWGILLVAGLVLTPVIGFVGYWVFWLLKKVSGEAGVVHGMESKLIKGHHEHCHNF